MIDMKDIQALSERIAREFRPQRIILFGSYAYGTPSPDSDADLLVILPFRGKPWRMACEIRRRTKPSFPVDLLVRSPEQLQLRLRMQDSFIHEIVRRGKILYET
jgi:predicted nucleotidyltransferase